MKICLDYGHTLNGIDSGAVGCGYREQDCTRELGKIVKAKLESLGHIVYATNVDGNVSSVSDSMCKRYNVANNNNVDLCVSLHFNAGGGTGSEIFTYNAKDVAGASKILSKFNALGYRNRGIKAGNNLAMIIKPKAPAMLIEVCFIDTQADMDLYASKKEELANAIVEGITGQSVQTSTNNTASTSNTEKGYVVTDYLPHSSPDYDGVDIGYVLSYFKDIKCYVRGNAKGVWIETQYLSMEKCNELKKILGSWFYSINK